MRSSGCLSGNQRQLLQSGSKPKAIVHHLCTVMAFLNMANVHAIGGGGGVGGGGDGGEGGGKCAIGGGSGAVKMTCPFLGGGGARGPAGGDERPVSPSNVSILPDMASARLQTSCCQWLLLLSPSLAFAFTSAVTHLHANAMSPAW